MEIVVAFALLYGTVKGVEWAAEWATKRATAAAKSKWRSYSGKPRPTAPVSRVGRTAGRVAATGWHATAQGGRGFVAGWRAGWPEGKRRVYDWHDARQQRKMPPPVTDGPDAQVRQLPTHRSQDGRPAGTPIAVPGRRIPDRMPPRTVGSSALADERDDSDAPEPTDPEITIYHNNGRWERHSTADPDEMAAWESAASQQAAAGEIKDYDIHRPDDQPERLASVTPITGGDDMSIATVTGGEVTTFDALIAELGEIEKEAAGDLEDATADAQRAQEDSTRVETMHASLASLDLDEQTLGDISALLEDSSSRLAAAEARQAAAESRAAHAKTASDGVKQRHALMQEAHDATPHPAEKAFYGR